MDRIDSAQNSAIDDIDLFISDWSGSRAAVRDMVMNNCPAGTTCKCDSYSSTGGLCNC